MESVLDIKRHSKYFFIATFLIIIIISFILAWPFVSAILGAIVLAYLFYPVYSFLLRIMKNESTSAFCASLFVLLVLIMPFLFVANAVFNETTNFFFAIESINFEELGVKYINKYLGQFFDENIDLASILEDSLNRLTISLIQGLDRFIFDIPQRILSGFVMFFAIFYLFKDGKKLLFTVKEALPLKRKYKEEISKKFADTIYATMYGIVVTALIQGVIGAFGLWIFGVPSPLLWGTVMAIFAMLPFIGSAFVWFPAAIYKLATNDTTNGVGLLIYGLLIVSTIDNIIRPRIIGSKSRVHPALVLIGALGGIKIFGIIGIVIGPLILAVLTVFFELYLSEEYEV